jgi:hypothetical protein
MVFLLPCAVKARPLSISNCAAEDDTAVERSGIEAIGSVLTGEYPSLQAVYLFGSAAEAEPGEALDVAGDIDKS